MLKTLSGIIDQHSARPEDAAQREWLATAMLRIEADFNRSADTHLHKITLNNTEGVDIYLKDEAIHPTGSLKHRLARSLILFGICNGKIGPNTTLIEASSGSTAVSESYFARLLDLKFIAVIPYGTSPEKIREIQRYGGRVVEVNPGDIYAEAARLEHETGGYYLDQFTNAERATDWRSNNNIAESLFMQMEQERYSVPEWVVMGAGTGGTSATVGRYIRYRINDYGKTKVCVSDPQNSVFFEGYRGRNSEAVSNSRSIIEGVGRPRVEPSFLPDVIDRMIKVSDAASIASIWWLKDILGRRFGPSTGLNFYASLALAAEMKVQQKVGSIVTLICDGGDRYEESCYSPEWLEGKGINIDSQLNELEQFRPKS